MPRDAQSIIAQTEAVFSTVERPAHFTDHRHCCECREHDEELEPYTPSTIPRSALSTMGWDPITFCTDEGFRYFLPGLIRIVLSETGENSYHEQFLWHTSGVEGGRDRQALLTEEEKAVVAMALAWLLEHRSAEIEQECLADQLLSAIQAWEGR